MSDAIEGADVMLYGVSLAYKESANVSALGSLISVLIATGSLDPPRPLPCICSDAALCHASCIFQCRMEANYAHQQELDMIPLKMQEGFSPKGWLGLILGTKMWYVPCVCSSSVKIDPK